MVKKELLIYNSQGQLIDKIDQNEEISWMKGYQEGMIIFANSNNEFVYYDLRAKKQVRKVAALSLLNKRIRSFQIY